VGGIGLVGLALLEGIGWQVSLPAALLALAGFAGAAWRALPMGDRRGLPALLRQPRSVLRPAAPAL